MGRTELTFAGCGDDRWRRPDSASVSAEYGSRSGPGSSASTDWPAPSSSAAIAREKSRLMLIGLIFFGVVYGLVEFGTYIPE